MYVRRIGLVAVLLFVAALVPLAAPGPELIGAGLDPSPPGWVLGVYGEGFGIGGGAYYAALWLAFLAYLGVVAAAPALGRGAVRALVTAAVVAFALAPPLLSLDVFSYVSYGSLQLDGLNPYEVGPDAISGNPAADRVEDFAGAVSVYGPVFTLVSWPIAGLGPEAALWAMKALAALSVLATCAVVGRFASARGVSPERAVAFVGLNPVVIVHGVGGAHNDVLMALGMIAALWLLASSRPVGAGVVLIGGVAVKAAGALAGPFALAAAARNRALGSFAAALAVASGAVGAAALALYGTSAVEAVDVLGGSQDRISRWSAPATLSRILGVDLDLVRAVAIVVFAVVFVGWMVRVVRGADPVRGAGWTAVALLLATAYMTPWYLVWALPLVAVSRDRALIGLTLAFTAFQLVNAVPL